MAAVLLELNIISLLKDEQSPTASEEMRLANIECERQSPSGYF